MGRAMVILCIVPCVAHLYACACGSRYRVVGQYAVSCIKAELMHWKLWFEKCKNVTFIPINDLLCVLYLVCFRLQ